MMKNINTLVACVCFFLAISIQPIISQVTIEGYAFESGNRGYLNEVFVEVFNTETNELISRTRSDLDGKFELTAPAGKSLLLKGTKDLFHETEMKVSTIDKVANDKVFVKLEMKRAPGYIFDITIAEKREDQEKVVDAIRGALIEVYNNTTREPIVVLDDHPHPDFRMDLEKGNHYTIMIRKEGYLAKRMEAFVNVKGCILCFEGVGEVQPGVSDNLTEGNQMGTLLANVELDKLYTGKKITLNNIYYDYGKATIRPDAIEELQNAITFLKDNPRINVELSSHTDSRGKASKNQALSLKRATNTVDWIFDNSELERYRITARGYGETKLINKCDDSADCTEAEHSVNRRTEFKILSIAAAKEPFKSLEKMKLEENMDDIIAELQSEGQVKVKDKADLDKLEDKGLKPSAANKVENKLESTKEELKDNSLQIQEEANMDAAATESSEQAENVSESIAEEVKIDDEKMPEAVKLDKSSTTIEDSKEDFDLEQTSSESSNKINTIGDFSGYKYVIHFSGTALPDDHVIFNNHDDLEILQTGRSNYLYMIGDYASKVYANSGLPTIKKKYPEAYVIGFKDGKRVE